MLFFHQERNHEFLSGKDNETHSPNLSALNICNSPAISSARDLPQLKQFTKKTTRSYSPGLWNPAPYSLEPPVRRRKSRYNKPIAGLIGNNQPAAVLKDNMNNYMNDYMERYLETYLNTYLDNYSVDCSGTGDCRFDSDQEEDGDDLLQDTGQGGEDDDPEEFTDISEGQNIAANTGPIHHFNNNVCLSHEHLSGNECYWDHEDGNVNYSDARCSGVLSKVELR